MATFTVKNKYRVVIPQSVRRQIGVAVGDLFEAKAEKGKIIFELKSVVGRSIAESEAEFKAGRAFGPFATHKEFLAALHKEAEKTGGTKPGRRAR